VLRCSSALDRSSAIETVPPKYALSTKYYVWVEEMSTELECPGWVKTGSPAWASECLLLGYKRKSISDRWTSESSHNRTIVDF
jgi:hypothetical protein